MFNIFIIQDTFYLLSLYIYTVKTSQLNFISYHVINEIVILSATF